MPRYAAFLRGVMPTNAKNADLKRAFEDAGFADVKTLLTSGNLVFTAGKASVSRLQAHAEAAMEKRLGRSFLTIVRPIDELHSLLASNPYKGVKLASDAKRIVTFLREPPSGGLRLPIEQDGARILAVRDSVAFGAYTPTPKGPVFMTLLDKTFGKAQTTRTWQTLEKVVASGSDRKN
jgi:uncharacterized protein (DUF1697 family)